MQDNYKVYIEDGKGETEMNGMKKKVIAGVIAAIIAAAGTINLDTITGLLGGGTDAPANVATLEEIPEYNGQPYVEVNGNQAEFSEDELVTTGYESYSDLDALGRCGVAEACITPPLMPGEEARESISQVEPTGWYSMEVDNQYVYNRCHLIGFQLTGENANEKNLITGTRAFNVEGMLPFENMVADYINETGDPVLYRVTPVFEGNNLVATGVQMQAMSCADNGASLNFNVFVFNVQDNVEINYETGELSPL